MFKKLLCLAVILGIAGAASATTVIYDNGYYGDWQSQAGGNGISETTFQGETVLVIDKGAWQYGAMEDPDGAVIPVADDWISFDIYFDPSGGDEFEWLRLAKTGDMWSNIMIRCYEYGEHIGHGQWITVKKQLGGFGGEPEWINEGYANDLGFIFWQLTAAETMYINNVKFIPEPATIAMLGLGGLALIRRKRS